MLLRVLQPFADKLKLVIKETILISLLGVLGIILARWSVNSKYALLGSLRTTAQMISYKIIMGVVILMVVFIADSMNLMTIVENQKTVWNIIPLLPIALIFFIAALAKTNRAPFYLPEARFGLVKYHNILRRKK